MHQFNDIVWLYSPCPRRKEIDTLSGVVRGTSANRRRQFSGASSVSGASTVSSGPNSISGTGIHDPRSSNNNSDGIGQVPQSPIPSPKFAGRHSIGGGNSRGTSPVHHPSGEGRSSLVSPAHENILMGSPQHNRHQMSPSHHPPQGGTSKKTNMFNVFSAIILNNIHLKDFFNKSIVKNNFFRWKWYRSTFTNTSWLTLFCSLEKSIEQH